MTTSPDLIWDEPIADEDLDKVVDGYGHIHYYKKGTYIHHRVNGPAAILSNGNKYWLQNDFSHRLDGAACEYVNGGKYWYYKGNRIKCSSQEEFEELISKLGFVKSATTTTNIIAAVNDHICSHCGNNRVSKAEKSCWKCGGLL